MTDIRTANESDVERLVEMGVRFLNETDYGKVAPVNVEQIRSLMLQLVNAKTLLVGHAGGEPTGMIGLVITRHFITGEVFAGEVFWWVEPEHRGHGVRLLLAAEQLARSAGAKQIQMIAPNERVAALYARRGYRYVESTYQRAL